jgi:hypothetical protein
MITFGHTFVVKLYKKFLMFAPPPPTAHSDTKCKIAKNCAVRLLSPVVGTFSRFVIVKSVGTFSSFVKLIKKYIVKTDKGIRGFLNRKNSENVLGGVFKE